MSDTTLYDEFDQGLSKSGLEVSSHINRHEFIRGLVQMSHAVKEKVVKDQDVWAMLRDPTIKSLDTIIGTPYLVQSRRSGNTYRQIDAAVQIIIHGKNCIVIDHTESMAQSRQLFKLILNRMKSEHPHVELDIDATRLHIMLKRPASIRYDENNVSIGDRTH